MTDPDSFYQKRQNDSTTIDLFTLVCFNIALFQFMWPLQGIVSVLFLIIILINYTFPCMQVNSMINKKKFL